MIQLTSEDLAHKDGDTHAPKVLRRSRFHNACSGVRSRLGAYNSVHPSKLLKRLTRSCPHMPSSLLSDAVAVRRSSVDDCSQARHRLRASDIPRTSRPSITHLLKQRTSRIFITVSTLFSSGQSGVVRSYIRPFIIDFQRLKRNPCARPQFRTRRAT